MSTLEPAAQSKPPGGFKLWLSQLQMKHGRKLVIALPYIWLILLFLLPFLIVFKIINQSTRFISIIGSNSCGKLAKQSFVFVFLNSQINRFLLRACRLTSKFFFFGFGI